MAAVNDNPTVSVSDLTVTEDTPTNFTVTASDVDGDTLTTTISGVSKGTVTGTYPNYVFTPTKDANGAAEFTVNVSDGKGGTVTLKKSFTIIAVNDNPTVSVSDLTVTEDTPANFTVTAADVDGDTLTTTITGVTKGTVAGTYPNYVFTPTKDANGAAEFTVNVSDGKGGTVTLKKTFTIVAVNDNPTVSVSSFTVTEDTSANFTVTASDVDGDTLTTTITGVTKGAVTGTYPNYIYTPNLNVNGAAEFTVNVSDGKGGTVTLKKSFTIVAVNDNPTVSVSNFTVTEDTPSNFTVTASDVDGDALTTTITGVTQGKVTGTYPNYTYTPNLDVNGAAEFTVQVTDGHGGSVSLKKTFTIVSVNDLPVISITSPSTNSTFDLTSVVTIAVNATDVEGAVSKVEFYVQKVGETATTKIGEKTTTPFTWDWTPSTEGNYSLTAAATDSSGARVVSSVIPIVVQQSWKKLTEAPGFLNTLSIPFVVPQTPQVLKIQYRNLAFDSSAVGKTKDAFELALLDAQGKTAVTTTIRTNRDSFYNLSEGQPGAQFISGVASQTNSGVTTVFLKIDGLTVGTNLNVVARLINNDGDTSGAVEVLNTIAFDTLQNFPSITPPTIDPEVAPSTFSPSDGLVDVTNSISTAYGVTSFKEDGTKLFVEMVPQNTGTSTIRTDLVAVVSAISDPSITIISPDGLTPAGLPYLSFKNGLSNGSLAAGASAKFRTLTFSNPQKKSFTYTVQFLGKLNEKPTFTSSPVTDAVISNSWLYNAVATDPDGDTLTYSVFSGPAGLAINSSSGQATWTPSAAGSFAVTLRVSDGKGETADQSFSITVSSKVQNRPPLFTTLPSSDAFVGKSYSSSILATDPDGDAVTLSLVSGPSGLSVTSGGQINWLPTADQVGLQSVQVRATDSAGATASQSFAILVSSVAGNHAPKFTSIPLTDFSVGLPNAASGEVTPNQFVLSLNPGATTNQTVSFKIPPIDQAGLTADVVFMVDESGSMGQKQAWLTPFVQRLDAALMAKGVKNNRYSLIGFGDSSNYFNMMSGVGLTSRLFSPDGTELGSSSWAPNTERISDVSGFSGNTVATSDGDYTLLVSTNTGSSGQVNYTVSVDDAVPTSLSGFNTTFAGTLPPNYTRVLSAPRGTLVFNDAIQAPASSRFDLINPSGVSMVGGGGWYGDAGPYVLPESGDYRFMLNNATGSFKGRIIEFDSGSELISLDQTVSGTITDPEATKVFKITLQKGQNIHCESSLPGESPTLFGPSGSQIWAFGNFNIFDVVPPTTGTYYLTLPNHSSSARPYRFSIQSSPMVSENFAWNQVLSGSIQVKNQIHYYEIPAVAGKRMVINPISQSVNGAPENIQYRVVSPQNEVLYDWTAMRDTSNPITCSITGTYKLYIYGPQGSYQIKVLDLENLPSLPLGTDVTFNLNGVDRQLKKVHLEKGQILTSIYKGGVNATSYLYGARSTPVVLFGSTNFSYAAPASGDYYYMPWVDGVASTTVNLTVQTPSAVTISGLDQPFSVSLAPHATQNFTFTAAAGTPLLFNPVAWSQASLYLNVRAPSGDIWTGWWVYGNADPVIVPVSGTYTLEVSNTSDTAATGSFYFWNLDQAPVLSAGTQTSGLYPGGNQIKPYKISAIAGQSYLFPKVDSTQNVGTWRLYGSSIEYVNQRGFDDLSVNKFPYSGTYYLILQPNLDQTATVQYNFRYEQPPSTTAELSLNQKVVGDLNEYNEEKIYYFSATAGQKIFFDGIPANDSNALATVYTPRGDAAFHNYTFGPFFGEGENYYTVKESGTHFVKITTSPGAKPRHFEFKILDESSLLPIVDQKVLGTIPNPDSALWYKIPLLKGQKIVIDNRVADLHSLLTTLPHLRVDQSTFGAEDGRHAIDLAMKLPFRSSAAHNLILISDASPAYWDAGDLDRLSTLLNSKKAAFNAIIGADIRTSTGDVALGLDSTKITYTANGSGGYTTSANGVYAGFKSIDDDASMIGSTYVPLAMQTGGAIWDIYPIIAGGNTTESFTQAIVDAKTQEILSQLSVIDVVASDPSVSFVNTSGPKVGGLPGEAASFNVKWTANTSTRAFQILFTNPGSGRVIGSIPVLMNNPYSYEARAMDADGDTLTYKLLSGPSGATVNSSTGALSWNPTAAGTYPFTLRVQDTKGGYDDQTFNVIVSNSALNHPPVISSSASSTAVAGRTFGYQIVAKDPDNNPLFYQLLQGPPGMVLNSKTGFLGWTPSASFVGSTVGVEVQVSDGLGGVDTQSFDVAVVARRANAAPLFASDPVTDAVVGETYRYVLQGYDQDKDSFSFSIGNGPEGLTLDPVTNLLTWEPFASQIGTQDVILRITDAYGDSTLQSFSITVTAANHPPVFLSTPPLNATTGYLYQYKFKTLDPDKDLVSYELKKGPPGNVTFEATAGRMTFLPAFSDVGSYPIEIIARDSRGATTSQTYTLVISNTGTNELPTITSSPRLRVRLGDPWRYQVEAQDNNGDPLAYSIVFAPSGMTISADGLMTWTPTSNQFGVNPVKIQVSDGRGAPVTQEFSLSVVSSNDNQSPKISTTAPLNAAVGKLWSYNLKATDADGDPIAYGLDQGPSGMTIDAATGAILWTPDKSQIGTQNVEVRAADPLGGADVQSFVVQVRGANLPPTITSVAQTEAGITSLYRYAVTATDPEGDTITFKLLTAPSGMTIDSTSGVILWTPTSSQLGLQNVEVSAQDSFGGITSQGFQIHVDTTVRNNPPVFSVSPQVRIGTGLLYQLTATASDPDGETVAYSLAQSPAGMSINSSSGLVSYQANTAGTFTVQIRATDPRGGVGRLDYSLTVGANQNPIISSVAPTTAVVGQPVHYLVNATDPENEKLTYTLSQAPAGAVLNAIGTLDYTPTAAGSLPFTIQVKDASGGITLQSFTLVVTADTSAPDLQLALSSNIVNPNEVAKIQVTAIDNAIVQSVTLQIDGLYLGFDTTLTTPSGSGQKVFAQFSQSFAAPGLHTILVTSTDSSGNTSTQTAQLRVAAPGDTTAPYVELHLDNLNALGGVIESPTDFIATIKDSNLAFWKLEVAPLNLINSEQSGLIEQNPAYRTVAQGTGNINHAAIYQINPTMWNDGAIYLRLTAQDVNGETTVRAVPIDIHSENLKLGRMTYSVPDLVIPLAGLPITVTRTYDTLDAARDGDFGHGWTLAVGNAKIEESVPINQAEKDGNGFFAGVPFKVGTRVTLTNPDGRRVGFTFQPIVAPVDGNGLFGLMYFPRFIPDPGVYDKLEVEDSGLTIEGNGDVKRYLIKLPYNPDTYKLTTRDGKVWNYQQTLGLLNVTDRNGNVLTYKEDGIYHSSGAAVKFIRDSVTHRINRIDYPVVGGTAGQVASINYTYDSNGDLVKVTDASGRFTTFNYHPTPAPFHFLKQVLDPAGNPVSTTTFDNITGRLSTVADALGNLTQIFYDDANRRETRVNPLNKTTVTDYDERGNIIKATNEIGNISTTKYDDNNNPIEITPPCGCTTKRNYDSNGNVLTISDPQNGTKIFTYDSFSNVTSQTDENGRSTVFYYDKNGQLTQLTDPAGNVVQMSRDVYGRVSGLTDPKGRFTRFDYEETPTDPIRPEKPKKVTYVDGSFISFAYNSFGAVTSATDELGNTQTLTTDDSGLLSARKDALNNLTKYDYNPRGDLIQVTDSTGAITKFEVDLMGRRTKMTGPNGEITKYEYDTLGRLWKTTDANNRVTTRGYRDDGVMTSVTQNDGTITQFEYDTNGRRTAVIDPLGNRTEFTYDGNSRVTKERNALGQERYYTYDLAGNLTRVSRSSNYLSRDFAYDSLNRLVTETWKNNYYGTTDKVIYMSYDELGNLVSATDEAGTHAFEYDPRNRTQKITTTYTGQQPFVLNYAYDTASRLDTVIDGSGVKIKNGYNARSELTSIQWNGGTVQNTSVRFTKNSLGDLTEIARYASLDLSNLVGKSSYTMGRQKTDAGVSAIAYNVQGDRDYLKPYQQLAAMGPLQNPADLNEMVSGGNMPLQRTTGATHTNATGTNILANTYGYNTGGELISETRSLFGDSFSVGYDTIGQVKTSTQSGTGTGFRPSETFAFDSNGNRTSDSNRTFTVGTNNQILQDSLYTYLYDGEGNRYYMQEKATGQETFFRFDHRNRLTQVEKVGIQRVNFTYDLFDRRIKKEVVNNFGVVTATTN
ncbi:MAG: Ig-like domain-containing protein [Verrucomicrobiota bacterium]